MSRTEEIYEQIQVFNQHWENYTRQERELIIKQLRTELNKKE